MVLNYYPTNYTGWPIPALLLCYISYEKYLKYPNISANIFLNKY